MTRQLEENGWRGACVNPFPDKERSCTAISMPLAVENGEQVEVADCTGGSSPLQVLLQTFAAAPRVCPTVERAGVGFEEMLKLSKAPPVIDYVALDTAGSELAVLQKFPSDKYCVRAWTVQHYSETDIREFFTDQKCRLKEAGGAYFARCPCTGFSANLLQGLVIPQSDSDVIAAAPHHRQRRKKKWGGAAMVSSGMLPEETRPHTAGDERLVRRST